MSTELGPLPEPEAFFSVDDYGWWVESRDGSDEVSSMFTADQMRAYAAAEVAKERERLADKWITTHGFDRMGVADWIRKSRSKT